MRIREDESGQMLVLTALSMALLLGFVALAVDVGTLFRAQRKLQIAADAAAIAAALDYAYSTSPNIVSVADTAAAANGVTNFSQVAVNSPPSSGYHTGLGYIEVVIRQPNPTFFMKVFKMNSITVTARSVAGTVPNPACIYVLDPYDANTLILQGNDTINTPNCGIQVNSNSPQALCITGGSSTVNAPYLRVVGGQSPAGNCKGTPSGTTVQAGIAPVQDPLNGLSPPPSTACNSGNTVSIGGKTPTVYSTTPIPSSTYTVGTTSVSLTCFSDPNVVLANGVNLGTPVVTVDPKTGVSTTTGSNSIFLFKDGVTIGGTVKIYGTLDNYQGTFSQGNSPLSVYAPANNAYPYNGLAVMQPSTNGTGTCSAAAGKYVPCLQMQFGSGWGNLDGLVYAPTSMVFMQDNGGGLVTTGIIAWQMTEQTSQLNITNNYSDAHPSTTPLKTVAMVE